MLGSLGMPEILMIFFGILILFGGKKIPEFARGIGKGIREFKGALKDVENDLDLEESRKPELK